MKTLKLPYKSEFNFVDIQKEYSTLVRYAFKRLKEGKNQKEIRQLFKETFNLNFCNSFHKQCAIHEAVGILKRVKEEKIIFGGKTNFYKRLKGKITKEEYQSKRLLPLNVIGETTQKGNRSFELDLQNSRLVFKLDRKNHFEVRLPNLRKGWRQKLEALETRCKQKLDTFQVRIDSKFVYITFEEPATPFKLKQNRYIGIDLNPSNIGVSVIKNGKIVEVKEYDFNKIVNQFGQLKVSSSSKEVKYLNSKLNHELFEISKDIQRLTEQHRCKFVFVEDLSFKQGKTSKGKRFNRLVFNLWRKNKFVQNLQNRIEVLGGKLFKVNPVYTSFIGNVKYNFSDPVNASIEIARRGYEVIILKNKRFYPELTVESIKDQWKEYLSDEVGTWKEFFAKLKNSNVRYRVPSEEFKMKFKSLRSLVDCITGEHFVHFGI